MARARIGFKPCQNCGLLVFGRRRKNDPTRFYYAKLCPRCAYGWRSRVQSGMNNSHALPIGTRLKWFGKYWRVKIGPFEKDWILEHRLIAGQQLGRSLNSNEHVHHINGDGFDNRPENLQVMSQSEHTALHERLRGH